MIFKIMIKCAPINFASTLIYHICLVIEQKQKRFYTRGTLKGIIIHNCLKSLPCIVIGEDHCIKKSINYLSCIEGKGDLKDIHCTAQNAAFLYLKISFTKTDFVCFLASGTFSIMRFRIASK